MSFSSLQALFFVFIFSFSVPSFGRNAVLYSAPVEGAAATEQQPPSYILYWGFLEAKFKLDKTGTHYEATTEIAPAEFRKTIQREPRLWTGEAILKTFQFTMEDIIIQTDERNDVAYTATRGALDNLAVRADNGTIYTLRLTLPDGKLGQVIIKFKIEKLESGEKEFWQKSGLGVQSIWGDTLSKIVANQEFLSHKEFLQALDWWIAQMKTVPLTSDYTGFISVIRPGVQAYEIEVPRSIADSLEQVKLKEKLTDKIIEPGTQVFFQIRPNGAWVGDFLLFNITKENDPVLQLKKYDRRLFGFEWGAFRFELKGYYGLGIQLNNGKKRPIDPEKIQEEKDVPIEKLQESVIKPMWIWEKGAIIKDLHYEVEIDDQVFSIESSKGIPMLVQAELKNRITTGKRVTLKNFTGENLDLRNLSFELTAK